MNDAAPSASVAASAIPLALLNDGRHMPRLGFGVWQIENNAVPEAVSHALEAGYRLFDTAQGYDNEEGVGRALNKPGIQRDALFVTSKLRTKAMGYDGALAGVQSSLEILQLDYLDMMLIHWPTPAHDKYAATWKGLVQAQKDGLVRTIGVSNFLPEHLERIIDESGVIPAVNQLELHPYFQQHEVREFHDRHGIRLEAYSPLGHGEALEDPTVAELAETYGKSPAQVIIRWHLQADHVVIPKSQTPDRIRENRDVFDFELTDQDLEKIAGLERGEDGRTSSNPATFNDLY